jgi:hypothetical protein
MIRINLLPQARRGAQSTQVGAQIWGYVYLGSALVWGLALSFVYFSLASDKTQALAQNAELSQQIERTKSQTGELATLQKQVEESKKLYGRDAKVLRDSWSSSRQSFRRGVDRTWTPRDSRPCVAPILRPGFPRPGIHAGCGSPRSKSVTASAALPARPATTRTSQSSCAASHSRRSSNKSRSCELDKSRRARAFRRWPSN